MLVVTAACLLVVVALVVALARTRAQVDRMAELTRALTDDCDEAIADARRARDAGDLLRVERDDALERVQRARRDAAEVANRLQDERAARTGAEEAGAAATAERDELQREVVALRDELATRVVPTPLPAQETDAEVLWELAVARVERTWRTSIALLPDEPSPIEGASDTLRAATEVLVDAARQEAGADIELEWSGDSSGVGAHRAVLVLSVAEAIIETVAKVVAPTRIHIAVTPDGVEISVTTDEPSGETVPLDLPAVLATGPGRFLVA